MKPRTVSCSFTRFKKLSTVLSSSSSKFTKLAMILSSFNACGRCRCAAQKNPCAAVVGGRRDADVCVVGGRATTRGSRVQRGLPVCVCVCGEHRVMSHRLSSEKEGDFSCVCAVASSMACSICHAAAVSSSCAPAPARALPALRAPPHPCPSPPVRLRRRGRGEGISTSALVSIANANSSLNGVVSIHRLQHTPATIGISNGYTNRHTKQSMNVTGIQASPANIAGNHTYIARVSKPPPFRRSAAPSATIAPALHGAAP